MEEGGYEDLGGDDDEAEKKRKKKERKERKKREKAEVKLLKHPRN